MKAAVWVEPYKIVVEQRPVPKILHPCDVIMKVTTTAICGSDLHVYEGRLPVGSGLVMGHENMGIVEEVGAGVSMLKKGDRIVVPFNVSCGHCRNCNFGRTGYCTEVTEGYAGGAYGLGIGPYDGGQAQYLRVPWADFNALLLPPGKEHEDDFVLLSDIFPTGWHGLSLSGFQPGDTVAVWGAGPVGLMAAYSALLRGASSVYVVDRVSDRLAKAKKLGCIPVDFSKGDAVDQIIAQNGGMVDRAIDCVGFQAVSQDGKTERPNAIIDSLARVVRPCGGLGIPGVYTAFDPGAKDEAAAKGNILVPFGLMFGKGLTLGTGPCNVKQYNAQLRDLIISGRAKPSFVISKTVDIEETADAYEKFTKRVEGYTKVIIHPNGW
ncbi:GroES-like protein [Dacryopinax primogenitus]|uniref:GroES-like protein n=1 Tax=Dacryopinax primogenitus (strain DJM 731) TaxID=1858805 RepID=M5GFF1_DACPD|nr:GroES-like protein [Dacryopinax primogenitus]EJU06222.1 GroES-like protein [Dacryopinax primogenitus]